MAVRDRFINLSLIKKVIGGNTFLSEIIMKYEDNLQTQIEAKVVRLIGKYEQQQIIGVLMFDFNISYEEAKKRTEQAGRVNNITKL